MSKSINNPETSLQDVRVHVMRHSRDSTNDKRGTPKVSRSDFVYVNSAYVGSVNSVDRVVEPPTSVIREQYWTCSKWTFTQRIMAIAVAVLTGAVVGLALTVALKKGDTDNIPGLFRNNLAPD